MPILITRLVPPPISLFFVLGRFGFALRLLPLCRPLHCRLITCRLNAAYLPPIPHTCFLVYVSALFRVPSPCLYLTLFVPSLPPSTSSIAQIVMVTGHITNKPITKTNPTSFTSHLLSLVFLGGRNGCCCSIPHPVTLPLLSSAAPCFSSNDRAETNPSLSLPLPCVLGLLFSLRCSCHSCCCR